MSQVLESRPAVVAAAPAKAKSIISPARLAHVVLRSSQFDALVRWYVTVLGATVAFSDGNLAFLSYDEEHHRIAVLNMPSLQRQPDGMTGVHHIAFTYASLSDLVATYERLAAAGINPAEHLALLLQRAAGTPFRGAA